MLIAETERLVVRTWSEAAEDVEAARRIWGDPEVMRQVVGGVAASGQKLRASLRRAVAMQERHGVQIWAVELRESGEVIGACGLSPFDRGPIYELSFQFGRAHWGRGYATEASQAVIEYAFDRLRAEKLVAGTLGEHRASKRVLDKLGFIYKGTIVWPDNQKEDPYYELVR